MSTTQRDFEYLCRVCAANTKGKYTSVPECVYIHKTAGLKQKIEKFLYLGISESDALPKVLCKTCFRQVEATASLSKIAKHTQKVFRDFLNCTGKQLLNINFEQQQQDTQSPTEYAVPVPSNTTLMAANPPPALVPLVTIEPRREEVVLNVSVSYPLTRETQQKMISASQKRQISQTDLAVAAEKRFAPHSIAQRAFAAKTPEHLNKPGTTKAQTTPVKKYSPPGVINFFNTRSANSSNNSLDNIFLTPKPLEPAPILTLNKTETAQNLFQKRKQHIKTTASISSAPTKALGQVSLLKVSQQKQNTQAAATTIPTAATILEVQPKQLLTNKTTADEDFDEDEEQLPPRMIIAAAKSQKLKQDKVQHQPTAVKTVIMPLPTSKLDKELTVTNTTRAATITTTTAEATAPVKPATEASQASIFGNFDNNIELGRIIRDVGLLKLIIKALKWPVNAKTLETQILRLRNSKFMEIMSDPNLLQDPDLTQILGPIILVAQTVRQQATQQQSTQQQALQQTKQKPQQQQSQRETEKTVHKPKAQLQDAKEAFALASAITYILPAETSVQLVPATSSDSEEPFSSSSSSSIDSSMSSTDFKRIMPLKKQKRKLETSSQQQPQQQQQVQKTRVTSVVISDDEDSCMQLKQLKQLQAATASLQQLSKLDDIKNNLNNNSNSSDGSSFDTDDIVLMEQQPALDNYDCSALLDTPSKTINKHVTFAEPLTPVITRPNIKHRKTVIQPLASIVKMNSDTTISSDNDTNIPITTNNVKIIENVPLTASSDIIKKLNIDGKTTRTAKEFSEKMEKSINEPLTIQDCTSTVGAAKTCSSNTATAEIKIIRTTAPTANTPTTTNTSSSSSLRRSAKSALGQQLLEAIGLQNSASEKSIGGKQVLEKRDSVAQIRSALKRSLKQAQEQQQRQRKEQLVIQDADSTTRSTHVSTMKTNTELDSITKDKTLNNRAEQQDSKMNVRRKTDAAEQLEQHKAELQVSTLDLTAASPIPDDVSSTAESVGSRKRGRKSKSEQQDAKISKTDTIDAEDELRSDTTEIVSTRRPTRMSKTLSKYYKGPEQTAEGRRSMPARASRSRNY